MKQSFSICVVTFFLTACGFAQSDKPAAARATPLAFASSGPILPNSFAGWQKHSGSRIVSSAAAADAANAQVLNEYGFTDFEAATFEKDGRTISVKAMRFTDTPGAYGAFTFYRQPTMSKETLCSEGASDATQVLFYCTNLVVQVTLDRVTAMSATQMRGLADSLPKMTGTSAQPPNAPLYLPESFRGAVKFVVGPKAFDHIDSPIPASAIDFSRVPEIAVAKFRSVDGIATAIVINDPTPKIATLQLKQLEDWKRASKASAPSQTTLDTFATKRSGPLVALVMGDIAQAEANDVLGKINYEADVTWSEPTFNGKRDNIGNLVVNILYLAFILIFFMLVMGLAIGGLRILARKFFPTRVLGRSEEAEIIRLKLSD
jgi:hypothetical protein